MPIYAYRCSACGHAQDVLQKISDPLLTVCPACGQASYVKQVTAAGVQLKGSGWYVTDFRNNGAQGKPAEGKGEAKGDEKAPAASADKPAEGGGDHKAAAAPSAPASEGSAGAPPAAASAPAAPPKPAAAPPAAS